MPETMSIKVTAGSVGLALWTVTRHNVQTYRATVEITSYGGIEGVRWESGGQVCREVEEMVERGWLVPVEND